MERRDPRPLSELLMQHEGIADGDNRNAAQHGHMQAAKTRRAGERQRRSEDDAPKRDGCGIGGAEEKWRTCDGCEQAPRRNRVGRPLA
jgi:hypothetical protein